MGDSSTNPYCISYPHGSQQHTVRPSTSEARKRPPSFSSAFPYEPGHFYPYPSSVNAVQNSPLNVQLSHPCISQHAPQHATTDSHRRHSQVTNHPPVPHPISYPESSQRTTSYFSHTYTSDTSTYNYFPPPDPVDAYAAAATTLSEISPSSTIFPSHAWATDDTRWLQSPQRTVVSPVSEFTESCSDESIADSDVDDSSPMYPMTHQFQIQPPSHHSLSPQRGNNAQTLQPVVMTFQLSENVLRPIEDPDSHHLLRGISDLSLLADEETNFPSPTSTHSSPTFYESPIPGAPNVVGPQDESTDLSVTALSSLESSTLRPSSVGSQDSLPSLSDVSRLSGPKRPKKSKMHQCPQCKKVFPRPSGLATHMNSHSGAKPFRCTVPNCDKSFAVRSNAKRHLRTHGINPSTCDTASSGSRFMVGFEEPLVTHVHDAGRQPSRYRWIPQNNVAQATGQWLGSTSSTETPTADGGGAFASGPDPYLPSSSRSYGSDGDYERRPRHRDRSQRPWRQGPSNENSDGFTGSHSLRQ